MKNTDQTLAIGVEEAALYAETLYQVSGTITALPGEHDLNFHIRSTHASFVLKISPANENKEFLDYQIELLNHLCKGPSPLHKVHTLATKEGKYIHELKDKEGNTRYLRLLNWVDGRLWSAVNPHNKELLFSLGQEAGKITKALQGFDHPQAHRYFEWDLAHGLWTTEYMYLFDAEQRKLFSHFQKFFNCSQASYKNLRKSIVHNDANDNNIIVSDDLKHPKVKAIIDYGDAIYTQCINDLAIAISYGVMGKSDPLAAAVEIVKGYHISFPLEDEELKFIYTLVGIRLIISLTKSAINKEDNPSNEYLFISEKPAWELLRKWQTIDKNYAYFSFRHACGLTAHPNEKAFSDLTKTKQVKLSALFPSLKKDKVCSVDLSVSSTWLGHENEIADLDLLAFKGSQLQKVNPEAILAGGYLEPRFIYTTEAFEKDGLNRPENRTIHLGIDFWVEALTPIHAPFDGKVKVLYNNDNDKDYGPTLILAHEEETIPFYTLYGHLSKSSLDLLQLDQEIKKGELIAYVGDKSENGNWVPHLHFQFMLDLLGNIHDFPGVAFPNEIMVWKSICPDPNLVFKDKELRSPIFDDLNTLKYRKEHLGKSLSLSYDLPLHIVRGSGVYLIDSEGQKYLDTVNNVAHVGHENEAVVKAGQAQMALLNTNTRYLNEKINLFAQELLKTFPPELCVVHFVNSGSEANELALRMAKTFTGQKDMIAVEVGYHGNSNACIDISSYKFDGKGGQGAPEHTHIVPLPDSYRGLYQGENTGVLYANHVQEQIDLIDAKGRKAAAFIAESIISCGGQIELPKDYLKLAYEMTRKAGALCIADEVQVGMGRVGSHFWGFQLHDVLPDIVTIGKPLGNGHPVAAVVCTKEVAEAFANGMEYFNTFGGNPVSCAIGLEVLREIEAQKLQENALRVGAFLKTELKALQKSYPIIGDVRGQGLFLGIELVDKDKNPLAEQTAYLVNRMKEKGVLMSIDGKEHNVLKIKPPMVFSIENAKSLLERLECVLAESFMKSIEENHYK